MIKVNTKEVKMLLCVIAFCIIVQLSTQFSLCFVQLIMQEVLYNVNKTTDLDLKKYNPQNCCN